MTLDPGISGPLDERSRADAISGLPGLIPLWRETLGDPRICVAVLDGPVDLTRPCFAGAALTTIATLVPQEPGICPAAAHGTHVASIIFGQHGSPVRGIAPGCRGLVVPVFCGGEHTSACSQIDLARAITQAVELGAHVINISGGQVEPSGEAHHFLVNAVRLCEENGVVIVAAAGNEGCECLHVPAAMRSVLAVGAMDAGGSPLPFSNWGTAYRTQGLLAPGQDVLGAAPGTGTILRSGTSYATAVVSGVVALLLSLQLHRGRKADPVAVRDVLIESAVRCDEQPVPDCRRLLAGRLNIERALAHLEARGGFQMSHQNVDEAPRPAAVETQGMDPVSFAGLLPEAPTESQEGAPPFASAPLEPAAATPQGLASGERTAEEGRVTPSCPGGGARSLVYALGQIGYDFGTEARRDSFIQAGLAQPYDPQQLLSFLAAHPSYASAVTWTLVQEATPIYAIRGAGPFAAEVYAVLREFLNDQLTAGVELVSVPGETSGSTRLLNGQTVPNIWAEVRGMYSWSTAALVSALAGKGGSKGDEKRQGDLQNFLERVYYELRNLGQSAPERAINFAATNAFQVNTIFNSALAGGLRLDHIGVEKSPICRPGSDCWDVKLVFFHPLRRLEQAREVYRFTVDVSDVVPVTVGTFRHWHIH